jgi:putative membrane protein
VHRHIAWLTALRFQLRAPRAWETMTEPSNARYRERNYEVPELTGDLVAELAKLLSPEDHAAVVRASNRATQILALQSAHLAQLAADGVVDSFRHVTLERLVADLYDLQGRCERIKNFPYPRQFATLNGYFKTALIGALPFALLPEFSKLGPAYVWVTIPTSAIVSWVFHMLEKIGEATENPFMGGPNDVPISAMSRTIEIDLRELLGETPPAPLGPIHNILS